MEVLALRAHLLPADQVVQDARDRRAGHGAGGRARRLIAAEPRLGRGAAGAAVALHVLDAEQLGRELRRPFLAGGRVGRAAVGVHRGELREGGSEAPLAGLE